MRAKWFFLRAGQYCRMFVTAIVLLSLAATAQAQADRQASIVGIMTDESGAVLPGVTITATSPALQVGQMSTVSEVQGAYRLTNLPLGTYEVTYTLDGFRTVKRDSIRLTGGFTATLDVAMPVGTINETLTVSAAGPVVDVVSSRPETTLTRETLELIPTSRNGMQALMAQAPGTRSNLDVGGNTAGAIPEFRAFGQGNGGWPLIEGIATASPAVYTGIQPGNYIDYTAAEEAQVTTFGNDAEMPTRGVQVAMISKTGGNTYHGTFLTSYTNPDLISDNIDAKLSAEGIRGVPIKRRWDMAGNAGGYLVKDRLWFYGGINGRVNDNGVLDCLKPDGTSCETLLTQRFYSLKGTYRLNNSQRLTGYYQWNLKDNTTGASSLAAWESRFHQTLTGNMGKGEWSGTLRNNLVATALIGFWNYNSLQESVTNKPSTWDVFTQARGGASSLNYWTPNLFTFDRYQASGSVTWFLGSTRTGDHNLKVGFDYMKGWSGFHSPAHGASGDYILRFLNGAPYQLRVYNTPLDEREDDRYVATFLKDQWTVGPRLTLNVGIRFAFDQVYIPDESKVGGTFAQVYPSVSVSRVNGAAWNTIVPRIHASYVLTKDGLTVVKGGWGRFAQIRGTNEMQYLNPLTLSSTDFVWRDLNNNRVYDDGEVNLNPNGSDFAGATGTSSNAVLNRNESTPITDEFSLSVERQLFPNLAVRVSGIYSRSTNNVVVVNPAIPDSAYSIPITNRDPGPDGVTGNADDPGTTVTYWEYPTSFQGQAFLALTRINDPSLDASYKSLEIAVKRRLTNGWQAMTSYSVTKISEPPGISNPTLTIAGPRTPNSNIFGGNFTTEWSYKASGSYEFPFKVLTALNYEFRSGAPWARTVLFTGGKTIPSIALPVEPLGAQKRDNLHLLDARVRKEFRFAKQQFAAGVDVFNLLNINTVISNNIRSGPTFNRTLTPAGNTATLPFIPGRNVMITFNYAF